MQLDTSSLRLLCVCSIMRKTCTAVHSSIRMLQTEVTSPFNALLFMLLLFSTYLQRSKCVCVCVCVMTDS